MSRRCQVCGKGSQNGNKVSHSNIKTKTKWNPNLQRVKASVSGLVKKVDACTRCIRTGKLDKKI